MKKLIFVILIAIVSLISVAQNPVCDFLSRKVIKDNDMTIVVDKELSESYGISAVVPDYYDYDFFKTRFNALMRTYSDVYIRDAWFYDSENDWFMCIVLVTEKNYELCVVYKKNYVTFLFPKK